MSTKTLRFDIKSDVLGFASISKGQKSRAKLITMCTSRDTPRVLLCWILLEVRDKTVFVGNHFVGYSSCCGDNAADDVFETIVLVGEKAIFDLLECIDYDEIRFDWVGNTGLAIRPARVATFENLDHDLFIDNIEYITSCMDNKDYQYITHGSIHTEYDRWSIDCSPVSLDFIRLEHQDIRA